MKLQKKLSSGFFLAGIAACCLFSTNSEAAIVTNFVPVSVDNSSATRNYVVPTNAIVTRVQFTVTFEKYDGETFGVNGGGTPFYDEIEFKLTSPQGTVVDLILEDSFGIGTNPPFNGFFGTIIFEDSATLAVNYNPITPFSGSFRPMTPLAAFNGENAMGTWTLSIRDTAESDQLGYYSSVLALNTVVPEPSSAALVAVASLALFGRRRRA